MERLEQTGKTYIINGETVKARKKTNNKWFETQDSISYWEDFFKPKIVWNRIAATKQFALVEKDMFIQDSMHFIIGERLNYLCSILNSKAIQWLLALRIGEAAGGNAGNANNVLTLNVPLPDKDKMLSDSEVFALFRICLNFIQK